MNDFDDLENLLSPPKSSSPALREQLLRTTSRTVRRRKWSRRLIQVSALAASYAAGTLTVGAVWRSQPEPAPLVVIVKEPAEPAPAKFESPLPMQSPRQLELAAEQAEGAESAKLYLEAGRRYGRDWNDWASAMRCYRNALDLAAADMPAIDPTNDDWLLVKMKTERRESNANP